MKRFIGNVIDIACWSVGGAFWILYLASFLTDAINVSLEWHFW